MKNLGKLCNVCLCATCNKLSKCKIVRGDTEGHCEVWCDGTGGYMPKCSEYEKEEIN